MFNRNRFLRRVAAIASVSSVSLTAGCGLLSEGDAGGGAPIVVGTTSAPSTLDPAAPGTAPGSCTGTSTRPSSPTPTAPPPRSRTPRRAAPQRRSSRTYHCTLREGLKFADGDPLTARAVKYSVDRIRAIDAPAAPPDCWAASTGWTPPRPRHRLPPRQARRHLPLRARHAGAVDRRPQGLPGPRPAQGRGADAPDRTGSARTRRGGRPSSPATTATRASPSGRTTR